MILQRFQVVMDDVFAFNHIRSLNDLNNNAILATHLHTSKYGFFRITMNDKYYLFHFMNEWTE